jgi:hypothetical protein
MPGSPAKSLTSTAAKPLDTSLDPRRDAEEVRSWRNGAWTPGACSESVRPSIGAWSGAAIDECGEAVEQALQPELEQVLQIEVVVGSGQAFEDGEAARLHD